MSSKGVVAEVRHHSAPRIHMAVDAKRINADEDMAGMVAERLAIGSKSSKRTMAAFWTRRPGLWQVPHCGKTCWFDEFR